MDWYNQFGIDRIVIHIFSSWLEQILIQAKCYKTHQMYIFMH